MIWMALAAYAAAGIATAVFCYYDAHPCDRPPALWHLPVAVLWPLVVGVDVWFRWQKARGR